MAMGKLRNCGGLNDMESERIDDIKRLLDRFYSGRTDRADELRLIRFFTEAGELPPELEADKALFVSMTDINDMAVDIPEEYSDRTGLALEAEMKAERDRTSRMRWRKKAYAWSAAACLALAVTVAAGILINNGTVRKDNIANVTKKETLRPTVSDSILKPNESVIPQVTPVGESVSGQTLTAKAETVRTQSPAGRHKGVMVSAGMRPVADTPEEDDYEDQIDRYREEEQKMLAENYYVVNDEREADAIVNSIFSRLEGNMALESNRISEIGGDYEMEVDKLSY